MIGPEADQAAFVDGVSGGQVVLALGFQGEIDLHDGVLLHDADQHDQAHKRVDVQVDVEQQQRHQRAETGRRQTRENGDGVDVTLVQNAEHDVHHRDGDDQQHPQVSERALEGLRRALELRADGGRQLAVGNLLYLVDHLSQRRARLEVERDGGRREAGRSG